MTSYLLSSSRSNAAAIRPGASLSRHNTTREICGAVFRYCERGGGKPRPFSVEIPPSDSVFALRQSCPCCFSSVR